MKISELKKIAKENDYKLKEKKETKEITLERKVTYDGLISNVITISLIIKNLIFIENEYCDDKDVKMIKAAVEFAETPPEDREEIKKYFYEHNSMKTKGGNPTYLAIKQRPSISYPVLQGSSKDVFEYKVEFTDDEIEIFRKEYGICLDNFEKNEVEEWKLRNLKIELIV